MKNISPERKEKPQSWQMKRDVLLTSLLEYSYPKLVKGGVSEFVLTIWDIRTQSRFMFVNGVSYPLSCCCFVYHF